MVLLISDGLDADAGEGVAFEMERLSKSCARLAWLNPLLGYARFEPRAAGVRAMLSTSLRGVISQQLIPRAGKPGRVAALEILVNTPAVANLIRQGKLDQLENTMQSGAAHGMRLMDSAIQELLDKGQITGKDAYKKAINKAKFEPLKDSG